MKRKKLCKAMAQWLGLGVIGIQAAHAGVGLVVDTIADQPQEGFTTLREAIELANNSINVQINFDPDLFSTPQTITLQNGEINIASSMTIVGPGANLLTVDGANNSRLFFVTDDDTSLQDVEFNNITLTGGNGISPRDNRAGGCIFSFENLTLNNSVVTGCTAVGNGGGLGIRFGDLNLHQSTFISNAVGNRGSGVYTRDSTVTISESTFNGNRNTNGNGSGGTIFISNNSDADIINTTLTNNETRSGRPVVVAKLAVLSINNTTIFGNTGVGVGIDDSAEINTSNSIIANNTVSDCDIDDAESTVSNLNNLDSDGTCNVQAVNHLTAANVLLAPLADNGGTTMTLIPIAGSPAIDAADDLTCELFDQRGEERPQDGDDDGTATCDIGAVEGVSTDFIFVNGFE